MSEEKNIEHHNNKKNIVSSIVGNLAITLLEENRKKGVKLRIPCLKIVINGTDQNKASVLPKSEPE